MNICKYKHLMGRLAVGSLFLAGLFLQLNWAPQTARADFGELFVTPAGSGDCSQVAPCDLQTALGQAANGDTIYFAAGTYTGSLGAVITVTQNITLYGGWDGTPNVPIVRDPEAYPTTLDGEDARHVVHISGGSAPLLDGFIITGGKAQDGGGLYVYDASPILQNNLITANRTIDSDGYAGGRGGGIYVGGSSTAVITHNRILSNTSGYGGGIYHHDGGPISIANNQIAGNIASHRGGGILVERSSALVLANVISGNTAADDGGGMLVWDAAPQVAANHIRGNAASAGGGISMGNNATPHLTNNMLIHNTQDGLLITSSSPTVINNTIVGSGLVGSGDGIDLRSGPACLPPYCTTGLYINNIVVSYTVGIYGTGPIMPVIDYNDVWGNSTADYNLPVDVVTGVHNISLDPLFTNPAVDDYHLQPDSPCIDAGDPAGVPPAPATDIDGHWRPAGYRVDIGADEFALYTVYLPLVVRYSQP